MIRPNALQDLLEAPAESLVLDFKERLEWSDASHRFGICRDVAAFANRRGGRIVVGVAERPAGLEPIGMGEDDPLPDATEVNQLLREKFAPSIATEVAYVEVGGTRYGVIEVPEFSAYPHVCVREAGVPGGPPILRPGDVYVRSDTLSSERAGAEDLRRIIESAVAKTGSAIAAMVGDRVQLPALPAPAPNHLPIVDRYGTKRALRLRPDRQQTFPLRQMESLVDQAKVTLRGATVLPRYLDAGAFEGGLVLREPDRIVFEAERAGPGGEVMSVVEVTRELNVRLWESLWEDTSAALGGDKLDVTSMYRLAYAGLLFGHRLYRAAEIQQFAAEVGVVSPLGRLVVVDPQRFTPLTYPRRATTAQDLWVRREFQTASVASPEARASGAAEMVEELLDYWGLRLAPEAIQAQLAAARENLDDDV